MPENIHNPNHILGRKIYQLNIGPEVTNSGTYCVREIIRGGRRSKRNAQKYIAGPGNEETKQNNAGKGGKQLNITLL